MKHKSLTVFASLLLVMLLMAFSGGKAYAQGSAAMNASCRNGVRITVSGWGKALISLKDFSNREYYYLVNLGAGGSGKTVTIPRPGSYRSVSGWRTYQAGWIVGDATVTSAKCS